MPFESKGVQTLHEQYRQAGFIAIGEFVRKKINRLGATVNEEDLRKPALALLEEDEKTYRPHVRVNGNRTYYDLFILKASFQRYINNARAKDKVGPYRDQRLKLLQNIHDSL